MQDAQNGWNIFAEGILKRDPRMHGVFQQGEFPWISPTYKNRECKHNDETPSNSWRRASQIKDQPNVRWSAYSGIVSSKKWYDDNIVEAASEEELIRSSVDIVQTRERAHRGLRMVYARTFR